MDDATLKELRALVDLDDNLVYEAVKAGSVADLSDEEQLRAKAMQEHMHLKHVHNALEFADLREGELYEVTTAEGNTVNPMLHVNMHAGVKGQIEQDAAVRAAFEKMVATGTSAHHAEHVLCAMLSELMWESSHALETGGDPDKPRRIYDRKLKKLTQDWAFRKKLVRQFSADHSVFE